MKKEEVLGHGFKLHACPWCRITPKLQRDLLEDGMSNYYVECVNPLCRIQPRTKPINNRYRKSSIAIAKVISDWNSL